jgi:dihydropteroate synthase
MLLAATDRMVQTRMTRHFAGFALTRPLLMGIVNVTPDSFSDGGDFARIEDAIAHGQRLIDDGADIVDVGGESTRPGSQPTPVDAELARVLPVVAALAEAGAVVSIDTRRAAVMRAAIAAGARIVNDVTALTADPEALPAIAGTDAAVVLMHMRGEPATMQQEPHYDDAPAEIAAYLQARVAACRAAGIADDRIAIDPGIGFGKTVEHNLQLLANLDRFAGTGVAVLVGLSRKGFIGRLSRGEPPKAREPGSLAGALAAVDGGADILRVHDVAATRQALAVWQAIRGWRGR